MKGVEASIAEIKNQLAPFANQAEYKHKERELQELIKKYDTEIQAKKQKKYKRDVLDYHNMKVYKWQTTIIHPGDGLEDDLLLDVSPDTSIDMEQETLINNTPQQMMSTNIKYPYRQQQGTPYRHQARPDTRRVNYQEQTTSRTPKHLDIM